jgi:hypothetical protein
MKSGTNNRVMSIQGQMKDISLNTFVSVQQDRRRGDQEIGDWRLEIEALISNL